MQFESLRDLRMKGLNKFVHGCLMFVTYPIRHFFKFLLFLIVVLLIALIVFPLTQKVEWKDLPTWYKTKYEETVLVKLKDIKGQLFSKDVKRLKIGKKNITNSSQSLKNSENKKQESLSSSSQENKHQKYEVWNIQQKPAKSETVTPKKFVQKEVVPVLKEQVIETKPEVKVVQPILSFKRIDDLSYFDTPRVVEGIAIVYGPNELYIGDTYMYLYGIYTNEYQYDLRAAGDYLRQLIVNESIRCYIVAETKDNIPTGICFKGDQNLNQQMIDAHYADDVALSL